MAGRGGLPLRGGEGKEGRRGRGREGTEGKGREGCPVFLLSRPGNRNTHRHTHRCQAPQYLLHSIVKKKDIKW